MYIDSNKIEVFPSSNRKNNSRAIYTSELNLTGILNSITDQDSFLINADITGNTITSLECIIHGYYFLISNETLNLSGTGDLYLGIKVDSSNAEFPALSPIEDSTLDKDDKFKGLIITLDSPGDGVNYYLKIGSKTNDGIIIDDSAYFKFNIKSLYFTDKNNNKVNYPKITSEAYTGSNVPPANAKKGDIFIVYNNL